MVHVDHLLGLLMVNDDHQIVLKVDGKQYIVVIEYWCIYYVVG